MLTYEESLQKILAEATPLGVEELPLEELLGYATAEPIVARFPMPQFDNSAVDGYGVRVRDVESSSPASPVDLKLIAEIAAGARGDIELQAGCAIKILTGAVVPASVDAVIMREFCDEHNGSVAVKQSTARGENIRRRGAEFEAGTTVLPARVLITPPIVGLLASVGYRSFKAFKKPSATVIATGDELVEPGAPLKAGQIYNSNSFALQAALTACGITDIAVRHARDNVSDTKAVLQKALAQSDLIISTGGVSVGDYDFVKDVFEQLGVKTIFWRIAIKPGKPVYFGIVPSERTGCNKLVFGLPGNPVSTLVTFHQLVKPALLKMMGRDRSALARRLKATLTASMKKKPGRLDFVRSKLSFSEAGMALATPTVGQDSHMISGLANADSLIHFDADAEKLGVGEMAILDVLNWWS